MKKYLTSTCLALGLFASGLGFTQTQAQAQAANECGAVSIVSMNWQSAELLAALDKFILDNGYGCQSEIISGDTVIMITSMVEKGTPDIVPETWSNQLPELLKQGVDDQKLVIAANVLKDGAVHGWFIPKYTAEANPDIKTIDDALKRPDLFAYDEDKSKGAVHNGPAGWFVTQVVAQLYKAYGGDEAGFVLVDPGSAAGLDGSLVKAYERGENWLGYYWTPSSMLGKYEMVQLDHGVEHDAAEWVRCTTVPECTDPKRNVWLSEDVLTVVTKGFADRAGSDIMAYLDKRAWSNDQINIILAWMTDNQATGEDAAKYVLREYEAIWTDWVSEDAAAKIKAAL